MKKQVLCRNERTNRTLAQRRRAWHSLGVYEKRLQRKTENMRNQFGVYIKAQDDSENDFIEKINENMKYLLDCINDLARKV